MQSLDFWTKELFNYFLIFFVVISALRLYSILQRPYKKDLSQPKGSSRFGAFYALTFAMLPWKKESTKTHWATYAAGMLMHIAVFSAFLYAISIRFDLWPNVMQIIVQWIGPAGLIMAFGLFIKRNVVRHMRIVSNLDDFLSNLLVDFYLLGAVLTAYDFLWLALWRLAVILLLFWIPLGKIFHMLLFFVSRLLFGWQFGRRGVIKHGTPLSY
ncbi:MAG: hypothetical protein D8M58_16925 [Calditrichaeota bacterium]|nr:MAG: hypothetical protein DWQ03_12055 [Calditrichota bacterium]MBL1207091.1 hypothetical protein [Calditrichota bacterium]NOG46921.1 hypothetical protein [Calditrichota bacterium]